MLTFDSGLHIPSSVTSTMVFITEEVHIFACQWIKLTEPYTFKYKSLLNYFSPTTYFETLLKASYEGRWFIVVVFVQSYCCFCLLFTYCLIKIPSRMLPNVMSFKLDVQIFMFWSLNVRQMSCWIITMFIITKHLPFSF